MPVKDIKDLQSKMVARTSKACPDLAPTISKEGIHMKGQSLALFKYFVGMALAAGILFFMAAALAEPFKKIVLVMNDRQVQKSAKDWVLFIALSVPVGCMWGGLWLWFKGCEKKFLEAWFAKAPQQGIQPDVSTSGGSAG